MPPAADRQRQKTRGQRATSDILGGNEFEIEVDFISACCSTYLEERGMVSRKYPEM